MTSTRRWCRGRRLVGVAALWLLAGCGRTVEDLGSHRDLRFLDGLVVTDIGVSVVPERRWSAHPDGQWWAFRRHADLVVRVHRPVDDDLVFRLVPDDVTGRLHFKILWDGELLYEEPQVLGPAGAEITVPPELLAPGDHRLTLRRARGADALEDRNFLDNGFRQLEWRMGDRRRRLLFENRERLLKLAGFLELGFIGTTTTQMAGALFEGPGVVVADLGTGGGSSALFRLENLSGARAKFVARAAGARHRVVVAPGASRRLEVPLGDGDTRLELSVRGPEDGLYLWGAPFLRRAESRPADPIVLISLDTTRRDALSPYGASPEVTPNLQRFAEGATVFTSAWAASPWTLPSHASMFTGLYPSRHGAGVWKNHLAGEFRTLAELLRGRGFVTAGFAGGEMCSTRWGLAQGFGLYRDPGNSNTRGDRLTDAALEFLEQHRDDPFFLFVNYFDPHAIYQAPAEFEERFDVDRLRAKLADSPIWREAAQGDGAAWKRIVQGEAEVSAAALEFLEAAYLAEVAFMDHEIGRLLGGLREHGLFDRATIVMVSDHGEFLGELGFFGHSHRLDPELVEIPLLIKFGGQRTSRRVSELVSHVDVFATLVASGEPRLLDGIALRAGDEEALRERETVYIEEHGSGFHTLFDNMVVADHLYGLQRSASRELVWEGGSRCANRAGDGWVEAPCTSSWSDRLEGLAETLQPLPEGAGEPGELSEDERRRLEALGYL